MPQPLIQLRRAEPSDSRQLWEWANDPAVRASAFSSEPISWETHERWFAGKLRDADCFQFVAFDAPGEPVGQIRFDISLTDNGVIDAVADVSTAAGKRGFGFGSGIIRAGIVELTRLTTVNEVHAWIKTGNSGSCRAFTAAGFWESGREIIRGQESVHYRYDPRSRK